MTHPISDLAEYQRTTEGLLAARVEDLAFLAVPVSAGFKIGTGWRMQSLMADWTPLLLSGAAGIVADEESFRAHVDEIAGHRSELRILARRRDDGSVHTPWGPSQGAEIYADGIVFLSTASHGGFRIDEDRMAVMLAELRNPDGWYEEDAEWAKVATAFPDLFTAYERRHAEKTLRNSYPDAWESVYGRLLTAGESFEKDRRRFEVDHAEDWVAISAMRDDGHPGMTRVLATLGGKRGNVSGRFFLVPDKEYQTGPHGFVIDTARHGELAVDA